MSLIRLSTVAFSVLCVLTSPAALPAQSPWSSSPNAFGGQNFSNGGHTTPNASGGWSFWGR
jgi:hypothetical protein